MGERRKGRGRLSTINKLPDDANHIVAWAAQELRKENREQKDILVEFNERLAALSKETDQPIDPISSSAFNRYSVRLAEVIRRHDEGKEIANLITDRLEPGDEDKLTVAVAQTIKNLILELLLAGGKAGLSMKAAKEAADAVRSATAAQKLSTDRRKKVEDDFAKKADMAIDKVSKSAGLSKATVADLRHEFFGLRK